MCLAGADGAVQHERVAALARHLDDAQRRGVGDAVARPDDELLQAVPASRSARRGVEERRAPFRFRSRLRLAGGLLVRAVLGLTSFGARRLRGGLLWGLRGGRLAGCLPLACLGLFLARGLEEFRVDGEADLHHLAEDLSGRIADRPEEGLLEPLLEVAVGHADRQHAPVPVELRVVLEPELVSRLPDSLGNGPAQRSHDLAFSDRQSHYLPPAQSISARVYLKWRQER